MKKIIFTMGDPRGIGPEIILKSLACIGEKFSFTVAGSSKLMLKEAEKQGYPLKRGDIKDPGASGDPARDALEYIKAGFSLVKENPGSVLVTSPVEKKSIADLCPGFSGHTGYLAELSGLSGALMCFIASRAKMSLLTQHIPLREVPETVSGELIVSHIRLLRKELSRWFPSVPSRMVICGLNPHSGDGGLLGREEIEVFTGAIRELGEEGVELLGPCAPAAALRGALEGRYDFIVSVYHDQLLPAFKVLLGPSVNVTLGLGFVRTSPDHGPAFDLAGTGRADFTSMQAAVELGLELAGG